MNLVELRPNSSPETLAENFLELVRDGSIKWAVMVFVDADDALRFEWSRLPSNLAAIGAVEALKQELMQSLEQ